ncbi:hypothetical protein GCM10025876_11580 [Demequina litorisediminis]|uniref:Uncharacterized protein n=1 Tax=Demequina litorisediminis TaxID=1849022 RepID=A0ABQ6IB99_9MICO|nr:hypothetical protein GCM10025876_11580 [Demequina litorisediminis]
MSRCSTRIARLGVQCGEDLRCALDDGDVQAAVCQILGNLEPHKAGANDDGRAGIGRRGSEAVHVADVAQGQRTGGAGDGGDDGRGAGAQHEGVVGLVVGAAIGEGHGDGAGGAVDGGDAGADAHVDGKPGGQ